MFFLHAVFLPSIYSMEKAAKSLNAWPLSATVAEFNPSK